MVVGMRARCGLPAVSTSMNHGTIIAMAGQAMPVLVGSSGLASAASSASGEPSARSVITTFQTPDPLIVCCSTRQRRTQLTFSDGVTRSPWP
jgi:hypothetical protein